MNDVTMSESPQTNAGQKEDCYDELGRKIPCPK
jgi:hypothetical protein